MTLLIWFFHKYESKNYKIISTLVFETKFESIYRSSDHPGLRYSRIYSLSNVYVINKDQLPKGTSLKKSYCRGLQE
jgi:hypothetical protein